MSLCVFNCVCEYVWHSVPAFIYFFCHLIAIKKFLHVHVCLSNLLSLSVRRVSVCDPVSGQLSTQKSIRV